MMIREEWKYLLLMDVENAHLFEGSVWKRLKLYFTMSSMLVAHALGIGNRYEKSLHLSNQMLPMQCIFSI